jgi:hypothetical protein
MAGLTCLTRLGSAARRPSAAAPDHDKSAGSLEERIVAAGHHVGHAGDADDATVRTASGMVLAPRCHGEYRHYQGKCDSDLPADEGKQKKRDAVSPKD